MEAGDAVQAPKLTLPPRRLYWITYWNLRDIPTGPSIGFEATAQLGLDVGGTVPSFGHRPKARALGRGAASAPSFKLAVSAHCTCNR